MQYNAKDLYSKLFAKRWPDPLQFIESVLNSSEHPFWGSGGACREFSKEILLKDEKWIWLNHQADDFAIEVEERMRAKLNKWLFKALLGSGGLSKKLCNTETTAKWLMDRYVNELKNLFDKRYRHHIDPLKFIQYRESN